MGKSDIGSGHEHKISQSFPTRLKPSGSEVRKTSVTEPAQDPAVVFFPSNQDSECMDGSTGLVSNNGNQRNNNNDNNNNDNNNNNQNVNEATTDTMGMNMGMVILPP